MPTAREIRHMLVIALTFWFMVCVIFLSGCGGDSFDCYPGTQWSDRALGCVRYIPDDYGLYPDPPIADPPIREGEDRYDVSNVRIRDNDAN